MALGYPLESSLFTSRNTLIARPEARLVYDRESRIHESDAKLFRV